MTQLCLIRKNRVIAQYLAPGPETLNFSEATAPRIGGGQG